MSKRVWRSAGPGRARAGGGAWGAAAFRTSGGYTAQAWCEIGGAELRRHMNDGPIKTISGAKAAAERWLDERADETKATPKETTTP